MQILTHIKISYKNLLAVKLRSFLTILGIIIGVASVIVIFAVGKSAQELILDQIRGIGTNLIAVMPGASDENGPPAAVMGVVITTLKYDDLLAVEKEVPEIEVGGGYVSGTATTKYQGTNLNTSFIGTTSDYLKLEDTDVSQGRFFNKEEERNLAKTVVLGKNVAKDLFGEENPIGKKIKINDYKFTVIGILKERASAIFGISNQNDTAFIPLSTAQKLILGVNHLAFMRLKINSSENIPLAKSRIATILRNRHNIDNPANDDFSVRDQTSALKIMDSVTNALRYFLLSVGVIALIVGGVGIMNVMLIAVNQRIREVGLRKAVGAKNTDILLQFLIESATISFIGGILGIILGIVIVFVVYLGIRALGYDWQFLISLNSIYVAVSVSILIGLIFGLYPARKASRISPMEALRYE